MNISPNQENSLWMLLESLGGVAVWHNLDSTFRVANRHAGINWMGYKDPSEVIGISYENMRCKSSEFAEEYRAQDKRIIETREKIILAGRYRLPNDDWEYFIGEKTPIFDSKKLLKGILGYFHSTTDNTVKKLIYNVLDDKKNSENPYRQSAFIVTNKPFDNKDIQLTHKQTDVLFLYLKGYSAKRIGNLLSISYRTVEKHIENIKHKMHCHTKSELVDKCSDGSTITMLPSHLLSFKWFWQGLYSR